MCQNCGRNSANVIYESVINGDRTKLHLCDECASKMNLGIDFDFGMEDIFSNFFEDFGGIKMLTMPDLMGRERCAFTKRHNEINSLDEFDEILEKNRKKKSAKKETKAKEMSKIDELKSKLNECIKNEEYEKAAMLRDEIKKLEK